MSGSYVATTTEDDVQWLTAAGQSVGLSVAQVRHHLAQALSPAHAALLAEPVEDAAARATDWYADGEGEATVLEGLPPGRREAMTNAVWALLRDVRAESTRLAASPDADVRVLGAMLERVAHVPDLGCVRVRGDAPVLVAWGHGRSGTSVDLAARLRPVAEPAATRSTKAAAPAAARLPRLRQWRAMGGSKSWLAAFLLAAVAAFVVTGLLMPSQLRLLLPGEDPAGLGQAIGRARASLQQLVAACVPGTPTRQAETVAPTTPGMTSPGLTSPGPSAPGPAVAPPASPAPPPPVAMPAPSAAGPADRHQPADASPPAAPVISAPAPAPNPAAPAPTPAAAGPPAPLSNPVVAPAERRPAVAPEPAAAPPAERPAAGPAEAGRDPEHAPPAAGPPRADDRAPPPVAPADVTSAGQEPVPARQMPLHESELAPARRPFSAAAMRRHELGLLQGCWALRGNFATAEVQTREPVKVSAWRTCFSAPEPGAATLSGTQQLGWEDGKSCSGAVTARFLGNDSVEIADASDCLGDRTLFRMTEQCARQDDATLVCSWRASDRAAGEFRGDGLALTPAR